MPIEPIDLQVLFSRMLDVGKEVAMRNDLVNIAQSIQAGELVRQTEMQSNSVNQTRETGTVQPVGEEEGSEGGRGEHEEKEKSGRKKQGRGVPFQDPELGRNIDITG